MKPIVNLAKRLIALSGYDVLPRKVSVHYLGKDYVVRNGTIDDGDYDDAWMFALACHSRIIFDIGANIGQSAFIMLHAPSVECVVLVDPAPLALTIAADTLIRNDLCTRAKFVSAYVSEKDDEPLDFYTTGHSTGGHRVDNTAGRKDPFIIQVRTRTITGLMRLLDMTPDFVKVDAEGCEAKVLLGSAGLAEKAVTRFLIEMHSSPSRPQRRITEEVLTWCRDNHFAGWYLKEAQRLETADPVQHRGRYHLLLQPEGWAYPEWLRSIPQGAPTSLVLKTML